MDINAGEEAKSQGITEVKTFGGWRSIDEWRPYGNLPSESKYVSFRFDAEGKCFRESSKKEHFIPGGDFVVLGVWPAR